MQLSDPMIERARVLIADDQDANGDVLTRLLTRHGYAQIASTTNSAAVVELFVEFAPGVPVRPPSERITRSG